MAQILVIEDSSYQRNKISRILEINGHTALQAADGNEGLQIMATTQPDCIVLDMVMPGMSGIDVLRELHTKYPTVPVVVHTADIQQTTRQECLALGAVAFVNKPAKDQDLFDAVMLALESHSSTETPK